MELKFKNVSITITVPLLISGILYLFGIDNLYLYVIISIVFLLFLYFFGFIGKRFISVNNMLMNKVANKINSTFAMILFDYEDKYLNNIYNNNKYVNTNALKEKGQRDLILKDVYVDLELANESATRAKKSLKDEDAKLDNYFTKNFSIDDAIKNKDYSNEDNIVILGAAGSGKTTLLNYTALCFSNNKYRKQKKYPKKIPVLLYLKDFKNIINNDYTLLEAIKHNMNLQQLYFKKQDKIDYFDKWFEHKLEKGKVVIMLDGLDEVADKKYLRIVSRWVDVQTKKYNNNLFILTSRPHGYVENPIGGSIVCNVKDFNESQKKTFINNFYITTYKDRRDKLDPSTMAQTKKESIDLYRRIKENTSIFNLSKNPLLLTMICLIHFNNKSLPQHRVELYEDVINVFLNKRLQEKNLQVTYSLEHKKILLKKIAFYLMEHEKRPFNVNEIKNAIKNEMKLLGNNVDISEFLNYIQHSSHLLTERKVNEYEFSHLTFQEYLSAIYIADNNLINYLLERIKDDYWHETIVLYSAKNEATKILEKCIEILELNVTDIFLRFTLKIIEEGIINNQIKVKFDGLLDKLMDTKNEDTINTISSELLNKKLNNLEIKDGLYITKKYITNIEYQKFISDCLNTKNYFPHCRKSKFYEKNMGRQPLIGVSSKNVIDFFNAF